MDYIVSDYKAMRYIPIIIGSAAVTDYKATRYIPIIIGSAAAGDTIAQQRKRQKSIRIYKN